MWFKMCVCACVSVGALVWLLGVCMDTCVYRLSASLCVCVCVVLGVCSSTRV